MDADDVSMRDRLKRQVDHLDAHPDCALVQSFAEIISEDSERVGELCNDLSPQELDRSLQLRNRVIHGSVMMRTDVVRELGAYDEAMKRSQDYDLWLRISDEHEIHVLREFLYAWRRHDQGISSIHAEEQARYAKRARDAALLRRMDGLLARLANSELGAAEGMRIVIRRMRDEDEFVASKRGRRDLLSRFRNRIPILDDFCFAVTQYGRRRAVRQIIRFHSKGAGDPGPAGSRLAQLVEGVALD